MSDFVLYLGNGLVILGLFFIFTALIGIKRADFDLMSKLHASGISDSMGLPLCFIGIALIHSSSLFAAKSLLLALLILLLSPVITHSFVKSYSSSDDERGEQ